MMRFKVELLAVYFFLNACCVRGSYRTQKKKYNLKQASIKCREECFLSLTGVSSV